MARGRIRPRFAAHRVARDLRVSDRTARSARDPPRGALAHRRRPPGRGDRRGLGERRFNVRRIKEAELQCGAGRSLDDRKLAERDMPALVRTVGTIVDGYVPVDALYHAFVALRGEP